MYYPKTKKGFETFINKQSFSDDEIAMFDDYKHYLKERGWTGNYEMSLIKYYGKEIGFVEHIFSFKMMNNKPDKFQQIMAISEKFGSFGRNCYYTEFGMARGFHVFFNKKGIHTYYNDFDYSDKLIEYYEDVESHCRRSCFNPEEVFKDEELKYCAYDGKISPIDYIKLYRKYPIAEMIMKLKLYRLLNEKSLSKIAENKSLRKYIFDNSKKINNVAFQTIYNAFKRNDDPADYDNSLRYRIECGRQIAMRNKELYKRLMKVTTQEKMNEYLEKNYISNADYSDYIEACNWLQLNMEDTKVLYPHNFEEVHDDYTKQYGNYKDSLESKEKERISKNMEKVASKYSFLEYTNGKFKVIFAKSKKDLITEGRMQENCVGRMDYDKRQADEKALIGFVRKTDNLDQSYITMELSLKDFNPIQYYAKKNKIADSEALKFKEEYIEFVKSAIKEKKMEEIRV